MRVIDLDTGDTLQAANDDDLVQAVKRHYEERGTPIDDDGGGAARLRARLRRERRMTATAKTTGMTELDKLCVDTIRTLSMDAVQKANSGHPGTPMALAPIGYVLYTRIMRHSPEHPDWPNRDRFVLSAGHASMLLYSLLYLTGYGLTLEDLEELPPARVADRRPSRVRPRGRNRGDHRAARAGHQHVHRAGARRAHAERPRWATT